MSYAIDSLVPWRTLGKLHANELPDRFVEACGDRSTGRYFCRSISLAFQMGNVASFLDTALQGGDLDEVSISIFFFLENFNIYIVLLLN